MEQPLRILLIEDMEDHALLSMIALRRAGLDPTYRRVETEQALRLELRTNIYDIILSDYNLPSLTGRDVLRIVRQEGCDLPFVVVSGALGEEAAVEIIRDGAADYVMKDNLSRLGAVVRRETEQYRAQASRRQLEQAIKVTMEKSNILTGDDFFRLLVRQLSTILKVQGALIDEVADSRRTKAQIVAAWWNDDFIPSFEYAIEETPCARVISTEDAAVYTIGAQQLFAGCEWITRLQIESYIGIPLLDTQGKALGHLALISSTPVNDQHSVLEIMKIFASRASAELKRRRSQASISQYMDMFNNMQLGLAVFELVQRNDPRSIHLVLTNPAVRHLCADQPPEFLDHLFLSATARGGLQLCDDIMRSVMTQHPADLGERDAMGAQGELRTFSIRIFPLPDQCAGVTIEDCTERRRFEQNQKRHLEQLRFLSMSALDFLQQSPNDDIHALIARKILLLVDNAVITIGSYDALQNELSIRCVISHTSPTTDKGPVPQITGRPRITFALHAAEKTSLSTGRIFEDSSFITHADDADGLRQLPEFSELSRMPCSYAIGFSWKSTLYGRVGIHSRERLSRRQIELVEAFVGQAAVAVQQRCTEKELLHSEERFHQIGANIDAVFWLLDIHNRHLLYISPSFERITGISSQVIDHAPRRWMELIHPDDRATVADLLQFPRVFEKEFRFLLPDGTIRWIRTRGFPVRNEQGVPYRLSGISTDISEAKKSAEKERQHQLEMIQADKMASLGILVAGVAHEINNPNNFILPNSRIIHKVWTDLQPVLKTYQDEHGDFSLAGLAYSQAAGEIGKIIEGIGKGAERIKKIVDTLRNFARPSQGELTETVNVNQVINTVAFMLEATIRKATSAFSLNLYEQLPPVTGNGQQLEQVLVNLLNNACQALSAPTQAISVTSRHLDETGEIIVEVRDQGDGMSREDLARIATPFFTTKRAQGGTGLGLSICMRIIEAHRGRLTFTSQPGQGTCAQVRLPVQG